MLPAEVIKDAELAGPAASLKTMKEAKEAEPVFKAFEAAAAAGKAEAQFGLGYLLQAGLGTEASLPKAKEAYAKAVAAGIPAAKNNLGLLQLGSGDDPKKAVELIEEVANSGYTPAQVTLAQLSLDGAPAAGIRKDPDNARVWFDRAEAAGDPDAAYALGMMYENGVGAPADQAASVKYLEKAAAKDHTPSMIHLGNRLATGRGVAPDAKRGVELLEKALALGEMQARLTLGVLYETGTGVPKDEKKAYQLYTDAATAGDVGAYNKLGYFHENGMGTEKSDVKAAEWYKRGADLGAGVCLHNLAVFHEEGKGGLTKSDAEAFKLYYKAAMSAFVPSQVALGNRYRDGKGVPADGQAALAWYERAVQNNDLNALVSAAHIFETGQAGYINLVKATNFYTAAASKGHPAAMVQLGGLLEQGRALDEKGQPVKADLPTVYSLYSIAGQNKYKPAEDSLSKLKNRLTAEQIKLCEAHLASLQGKSPVEAPAVAPTESGKGANKPADTAKSGDKPKTDDKPKTQDKPKTETKPKPATSTKPKQPAAGTKPTSR